MPFRYERFAAIWAPDLTGDPSCRHRRVLAEYRGDSPPTIDPAQLDLPTRHEAEEQDDSGVFAGQRALCLHAPAEFLVEPLDDVRAPQCFPLRFGEGEEREKHDAVEVVTDLGQHMLRCLTLEIAELVDTAALQGRPRPGLPDGAPQ